MMLVLWIVVWTAILIAGGWVIRFVGQKINWPSEKMNIYFRDVPLMPAVGIAIAIFSLYWVFIFYFVYKTTFFIWAANAFVGFSIAAYFFRILGRRVGTERTKKTVPENAADGVLRDHDRVALFVYRCLCRDTGTLWAGRSAECGQPVAWRQS